MAANPGYGTRIKAIPLGKFATIEGRLPHGGSLQARRLSADAVGFYWRHGSDGAREPIGIFDPSAPPKQLAATPRGFSVQAALEECRHLAAIDRAHPQGLSGVKADRARDAAAAKAAAATEGSRTLSALLDEYVALLRARGRHRSANDSRLIFVHHVVDAFPELAAMPAADVSPDALVDVQRRLLDAGKGRTANKARSYLRAAYQAAVDVRFDASVPVGFKRFSVVQNPAAATRRHAKYDKADKRPLNAAELRTYWQRIKDLPGLPGLALRAHLLTGAQRIEQLLRLRCADVSDDAILIYDAKGRPGSDPRPHLLPLVAPLKATLAAAVRNDGYLITTTGGKRPISPSYFNALAGAAVGDSIADFQPKRLRSGVETLLAEHGVGQDVRAALQSHGMSGVQARHYDGSDRLQDKRTALELLLRLLDGEPAANVLPIKHRAKAAGGT